MVALSSGSGMDKVSQVYTWLYYVENLVIYQYSACVGDAAIRKRGSDMHPDFIVVEMPKMSIASISYKYSLCGILVWGEKKKKVSSFSSGDIALWGVSLPQKVEVAFTVACCISDFLPLPFSISKTQGGIGVPAKYFILFKTQI